MSIKLENSGQILGGGVIRRENLTSGKYPIDRPETAEKIMREGMVQRQQRKRRCGGAWLPTPSGMAPYDDDDIVFLVLGLSFYRS